jgi:hypothetical protein
VLKDLYDISKIQLGQYKDACKREKEAKINEVAALTKLKEDMEKYEKSKCGLPPGAKGKEESGCSQHSTNLILGDPAAYAYANSKTPSKKPPTKASLSSGSGAAKGHQEAMVSIKGMDVMMKECLDYARSPPPAEAYNQHG